MFRNLALPYLTTPLGRWFSKNGAVERQYQTRGTLSEAVAEARQKGAGRDVVHTRFFERSELLG